MRGGEKKDSGGGDRWSMELSFLLLPASSSSSSFYSPSFLVLAFFVSRLHNNARRLFSLSRGGSTGGGKKWVAVLGGERGNGPGPKEKCNFLVLFFWGGAENGELLRTLSIFRLDVPQVHLDLINQGACRVCVLVRRMAREI